jgi:hypothetical protein
VAAFLATLDTVNSKPVPPSRALPAAASPAAPIARTAADARAAAIPVERRTGADRRQVHLGPPGKKERRVSVEARKPEVQEVVLSPSDWVRFDTALPLQPKGPKPRTDGGG